MPSRIAAQIASGECTTTVPQDLPRAPEQIAVPQDDLLAATMLAPAPDLPRAPEQITPPQDDLPAATTLAPAPNLPRAPEQIAVPQDNLLAATTLAPTPNLLRAPEQIVAPQNGLPAVMKLVPAPKNAGPAASTTTINTWQKLAEKRYTCTEKMCPGLECMVRYVC